MIMEKSRKSLIQGFVEDRNEEQGNREKIIACIVKLEAKLTEMAKTKGTLHPAVRGVRVKLRDSYESLIISSAMPDWDVEYDIWKLHYNGIEEFRKKIDLLKRKGDMDSPQMQNLLNSFRGFLDEASGYFTGLIVKKRVRNGLSPLPFPDQGFPDLNNCCALSCHKLLVYLGDIARYKELIAVSNRSERDWTVASAYYKQAAALYPFRGHPHNQLAYLAIQTGDRMGALYHYCRSLAVKIPFQTNKDNLVMFLTKNRSHACKATSDDNSSKHSSHFFSATKRKHSIAKTSSLVSFAKTSFAGKSPSMVMKEVWSCFEAHFLDMLHAVLLSSCLEELKDRMSISENMLEQLFDHVGDGLQGILTCKRSNNLEGNALKNEWVLQVITILIYFIDETQKQPQQISKSLELFIYVCHFVSHLINKAKTSGKNEARILLPGVIVFLDWVISWQSFLKDNDTASLQMNLDRLMTELEALMKLLCQHSVDDCSTSSILSEQASRGLSRAPVWEDYELLGFSPLSHIHRDLDLSNLCIANVASFSFEVYLDRLMLSGNTFRKCFGKRIEGLDYTNYEIESTCNTKRNTILSIPLAGVEEPSAMKIANQPSPLKDSSVSLHETSHFACSSEFSHLDYVHKGQDSSSKHEILEKGQQCTKVGSLKACRLSLNNSLTDLKLYPSHSEGSISPTERKQSFSNFDVIKNSSQHRQSVDNKRAIPILANEEQGFSPICQANLKNDQNRILAVEGSARDGAKLASNHVGKVSNPIDVRVNNDPSVSCGITIHAAHCSSSSHVEEFERNNTKDKLNSIGMEKDYVDSSLGVERRELVLDREKSNLQIEQCNKCLESNDKGSCLTNEMEHLCSPGSCHCLKSNACNMYVGRGMQRDSSPRWFGAFTYGKPAELFGSLTGLLSKNTIFSSRKHPRSDLDCDGSLHNSKQGKHHKTGEPL